MVEETFIVEITKTDNDRIGLKVEDPSDETTEKAKEEEPVAEGILFSKLARSWTSTAISFFEVVPFLSEVGYAYADHDLEVRTISEVAKIATSTEEESRGPVTVQRYTIPMSEFPRFAKSLAKSTQLLETATVMRRSALTALLAEYEAFMAEMLMIAIQIQPKILVDDEPRISIKDLSDYDNLESLRLANIKKRLEKILHENTHKELLVWIEKTFGVNLSSNKKLISEFVEVCQRRHLISHAGSKANKRYIRICNEENCDKNRMLGLDEAVVIDRDYIRQATARVYQVGYFTLHMLWQKLLKSNDESDTTVLSCSHSFLENDLTKMACRVVDFSLTRKTKPPKGRLHAYLIINKAQVYKFDNSIDDDTKRKRIESALKEYDWSSSTSFMDLALACLNDEYSDISSKVVAAAKYGEHRLRYSDIYTYNIFRDAKDNSNFVEGVVEAFGKSGKSSISGRLESEK